jgi:DNA-binding NarL/FixJ family response regulator
VVEPQRVLLVDDHALFRDGLRGLFAYEDDFEVVGEAGDGPAALAAAAELMPDLVLMDVDLPGWDGVETTRRLKTEMPYVKVVMLTVHDDDDTLFEAIKAGAQGYLVKSIRAAEMLDLLRGLARGEAPISRAMATRILEEFARTAGEPGDLAPPGPEAGLTFREQEVLELVARRYSNKEIATTLVITESTVKNHLRNILSKLHLRSRTEAARYAHDRGLLGPGGSGALGGASRPEAFGTGSRPEPGRDRGMRG